MSFPLPPTNVIVTDIEFNNAYVTYSPPSSGPTPESYMITYGASGDGNDQSLNTAETYIQLNGLISSRYYSVEVRSVSGGYASVPSSPVIFSTPGKITNSNGVTVTDLGQALAMKVSTTGGVISGDLTVQGNCTVVGNLSGNNVGPAGKNATVALGNVTTGAPGTNVVITNTGTDSSDAVFNFTIPIGNTGAQGQNGASGSPGQAASVSIGTTSTLSSGAAATVSNSGSSTAAVLNFGIPQGVQGSTGPTGLQGPAATVSVGTTTTLAPGSNASVSNSGSTSAAVFNFSIPAGSTGATGATGQAATVALGTVSTLPAGSNASVSNSGSASAAVLNFGIPQGAIGAQGPMGATGTSATISVGTTTTGAPGSNASVSNSGSTSAAVFNFSIPAGVQGPMGATGSSASVAIGTVTTGAPGSSASVTNSGSSTAAVLNFTIPQGVQGSQGPQGQTGTFDNTSSINTTGNIQGANITATTSMTTPSIKVNGTDVGSFLSSLQTAISTLNAGVNQSGSVVYTVSNATRIGDQSTNAVIGNTSSTVNAANVNAAALNATNTVTVNGQSLTGTLVNQIALNKTAISTLNSNVGVTGSVLNAISTGTRIGDQSNNAIIGNSTSSVNGASLTATNVVNVGAQSLTASGISQIASNASALTTLNSGIGTQGSVLQTLSTSTHIGDGAVGGAIGNSTSALNGQSINLTGFVSVSGLSASGVTNAPSGAGVLVNGQTSSTSNTYQGTSDSTGHSPYTAIKISPGSGGSLPNITGFQIYYIQGGTGSGGTAAPNPGTAVVTSLDSSGNTLGSPVNITVSTGTVVSGSTSIQSYTYTYSSAITGAASLSFQFNYAASNVPPLLNQIVLYTPVNLTWASGTLTNPGALNTQSLNASSASVSGMLTAGGGVNANGLISSGGANINGTMSVNGNCILGQPGSGESCTTTCNTPDDGHGNTTVGGSTTFTNVSGANYPSIGLQGVQGGVYMDRSYLNLFFNSAANSSSSWQINPNANGRTGMIFSVGNNGKITTGGGTTLDNSTGGMIVGSTLTANGNCQLGAAGSNSTVTTASGSVLSDPNGNMAVNSTATSGFTATFLQPNMASGGATYLGVGKALSNGNSAVLGIFGSGASLNGKTYTFPVAGLSVYGSSNFLYGSQAGGLYTSTGNLLDDGTGRMALTSSGTTPLSLTSSAGLSAGPVYLTIAGSGSNNSYVGYAPANTRYANGVTQSVDSLIFGLSSVSNPIVSISANGLRTQNNTLDYNGQMSCQSTLTCGGNLLLNTGTLVYNSNNFTLPTSSGGVVALTSQLPIQSYLALTYAVSTSSQVTTTSISGQGSDMGFSGYTVTFNTAGVYLVEVNLLVTSLGAGASCTMGIGPSSGSTITVSPSSCIVSNNSATSAQNATCDGTFIAKVTSGSLNFVAQFSSGTPAANGSIFIRRLA